MALSGLSILDFGVKLQGYTTDVTVPLLHGEPNAKQREMIDLVHGVWDQITDMLKPGASTLRISAAVDEFFSKNGYSMPHGLGHGIGLDAHEYPYFRNSEDSDFQLESGMIIAIEPGLYDKQHGGMRLENDILITHDGMEVLTRSRTLYFPDAG